MNRSLKHVTNPLNLREDLLAALWSAQQSLTVEKWGRLLFLDHFHIFRQKNPSERDQLGCISAQSFPNPCLGP